MGRTKRSRRVGTYPEWNSFVPEEGEHPETVFLSIEEFETIRLIDYEHLTQQACADNMQVARTTVTDMYDHARFILADCLISGKKLVIAGGHTTICRMTLWSQMKTRRIWTFWTAMAAPMC